MRGLRNAAKQLDLGKWTLRSQAAGPHTKANGPKRLNSTKGPGHGGGLD